MDVDKYIEKVEKCSKLEEREILKVIRYTKRIFVEENNVLRLKTPIVVCGDVHGQFQDLMNLFSLGGTFSKTSTCYLFLGDFVDRGFHSVETITILLLFKIKYPSRIFLIRGNHESRAMTETYGFMEEIHRKYGDVRIWKCFGDLFDSLPICALIDDEIFDIHGGLSPKIRTIDQISRLSRQKIEKASPLMDLLWSDPNENLYNWVLNTDRGEMEMYEYGENVVNQFCYVNGLNLITRAHQVMKKGYRFHFTNKNCVTIFSAPNYTYKSKNLGAILKFEGTEHKDQIKKIVYEEDKETHENIRKEMKRRISYLLRI